MRDVDSVVLVCGAQVQGAILCAAVLVRDIYVHEPIIEQVYLQCLLTTAVWAVGLVVTTVRSQKKGLL